MQSVVWDACGLLNLLATGKAEDVLRILRDKGTTSFVVRQVKEQEVLYLRSADSEVDPPERYQVSLDPLVDSGFLQVLEMTDAEQVSFVSWAECVDDGEAFSLAVAQERGYGVATDDQATLNQMQKHVPTILPLTTPHWVKLWAESAEVDSQTVKDVVRLIERCARYTPRKLHPLRAWWMQYVCP